MSRFDYVRYDTVSTTQQERAKELVTDVEKLIDSLESGRAKSLAYTKLEECYMWIGKAIRDDQIDRGGDDTHVAERTSN